MKKLIVLKKMHVFQIITYVIILKQLCTSCSVNKNLDFVSVCVHRFSPRLRRIIVNCYHDDNDDDYHQYI